MLGKFCNASVELSYTALRFAPDVRFVTVVSRHERSVLDLRFNCRGQIISSFWKFPISIFKNDLRMRASVLELH
jgi:hypothetical protein